MRVLGIIPAKGTSRGVPRKNLAPLCGKPLIEWALLSALASKLYGGVVVSTEDERIANEARLVSVRGSVARIEMRPAELAQDDTPTIDVLLWHLRQQDQPPQAVCCLQPTCPLRRAADIDAAIDLMERTGCDSVVSYVSVGANHPARMARIAGDARVLPIDQNGTFARRQDLEEMYIRSGDIYLTRREVLESGSLVGKDQRAIVIPPERWCNIDTRMDLLLAELLMKEASTC